MKLTEPNCDIVRIVQCACYGKGYDPGSISAPSTGRPAGRFCKLMSDAGLNDGFVDAVPPKVVKALLTMDAYQLVAGGTATVRSIQHGSTAGTGAPELFVLACDGNVSRDVQKALYLAIQFELGMTDADANRVVRSAHPGRPRRTAAQGLRGELRAAVHRGHGLQPVRLGDLRIYERFTDTFDIEVTAAVCAFQAFSAIPVTGAGDYVTWCQLLVSDGDPARACTAVDCITAITDARAATLRAAGYTLVGVPRRAAQQQTAEQADPAR